MLLGLSYYSNSMLQTLILDSAISYVISKKFSEDRNAITVEAVDRLTTGVVEILDHEFFKKLEKPIEPLVRQRLALLESLKEIKVEADGRVRVLRNPEEGQKNFSFVSYFSEMSAYMYDTYMLVLLAVQEIQQGSLLVKESNLVTELHMMCLDMYNDN